MEGPIHNKRRPKYFKEDNGASNSVEVSRKFCRDAFLSTFLEAVQSILMIVNEHREVIYPNAFTVAALGYDTAKTMIGKRVGELLKCENANLCTDGCGFSKACESCSALEIFMSAVECATEVTDAVEMVVNLGDRKILKDLDMKITPVKFEDEMLFILSVIDKTKENLIAELSQTFFHDVINKISALRGYMRLANDSSLSVNEDDLKFIEVVLDDLVDIIHTQRKLVDLSRGNQVLSITELSTKQMFIYLKKFFDIVGDMYKDGLIMDENFENVMFASDLVLLKRVLINIVKNALEETPPGEKVIFQSRKIDMHNFEIVVKNKNRIPNEILDKLFESVVSTKGGNYHGWGTRSMKLIGEEYLKGKIFIETNDNIGTKVHISLPYRLEVDYEDTNR